MRIRADSVAWPAAAAVAFTLAVLAFTPLRMNLGWDETVYASQISQHMPIMHWGPERSRGLPLIVAPVTLLTGAVVVLRAYLAVLAGAGLFAALLCWRGLKPGWMLGLAGVIFGGLGVVESQASLLFPNYWIAVGALATVGLFVRGLAAEGPVATTGWLLALATAFIALMRPTDAVFLIAPLLVAAAVARRGVDRRLARLGLAMLAGLAVGLGEWIVEAVMYFHGPLARFKAAGQAVGGTAFNPLAGLKILGGGRINAVTAAYPGQTGWSHPAFLPWWLAFGLLAALGVWVAARREGWLPAAAPAICALSIYLLYSLPVRNTERYFLPVWALLAVPAAEGLGWLITAPKGRARIAAIGAAAVFLGAGLATQHVVLVDQNRGVESAARANTNAAAALHALGVHAPCVITSVGRPHFAVVAKPVAYYLSCSYVADMRSAAARSQTVVLVQGAGSPWRYAAPWGPHVLAGTQDVIAYVSPR